MTSEPSIRRYRHWYAKLLRLYSKPYYERFGEGMEQTFNDLLRERAEQERGLFGFILWVFVETTAEIIKENISFIIMQNITKRLSVWAAVVALILMVPLVAKWPWTRGDFIFAGVMLFGTGLTYELVARKGGNLAYRVAVGLALAAALLLVWINGAVGIIGPEDNPANLLYGGVLAIGFIGAIVALLEPRAMARALFVTAVAQALVPVIAFIIWEPSFAEPPGIVGVFVLNSFFVMMFVGSALLFRRASATGPEVEPTA